MVKVYNKDMRGGRFGYIVRMAALFAAYFVTARVGLGLGAVSGFATIVWAPSGIALAVLLIWGYRYWPGITLAAFLVNLVTGAPLLVALGISIGNTLEPLMGVYLLNRFARIQKSLDRLWDVLSLVLLAAVVSTAVSATVGVTSLLAGDIITTSALGSTWLPWWSGDMLGILVATPLLLVWSERFHRPVALDRAAKAVAPILLLIAVSILIFHGFVRAGMKPFVLAYVIFPVLMLIAVRFGQIGSVTATFLAAVVAIWGTVANYDASSGTTLSQTLLLLQVFIGVTAVTFMTLAAVVSEREQTLKHEQELIQKAAHLTKQRERLRLVNEAKDEFISIASHQLRTPATSVKQYLGMLLQTYAGKLSKEQRVFVQTAYEANEQQLRVVNDLLHVARLDSGRTPIEKSPCDITRLVADVINQHSKVFDERGQKLLFVRGKKPVKARVDKNLVRMMLENIIDNAGKYSPEDGEISINVAKTGQKLVMRITDQGIGIAKQDQKRLFRKFSRVSNARSNNISGSGLGLYWAQKVARMHGGAIDLASEPNKGSTFTITLPA